MTLENFVCLASRALNETYANAAGVGGHQFLPIGGHQDVTVTDFKGMFGVVEIRGAASDGDVTYDLAADICVMKGQYISMDGQPGDTAFAFV